MINAKFSLALLVFLCAPLFAAEFPHAKNLVIEQSILHHQQKPLPQFCELCSRIISDSQAPCALLKSAPFAVVTVAAPYYLCDLTYGACLIGSAASFFSGIVSLYFLGDLVQHGRHLINQISHENDQIQKHRQLADILLAASNFIFTQQESIEEDCLINIKKTDTFEQIIANLQKQGLAVEISPSELAHLVNLGLQAGYYVPIEKLGLSSEKGSIGKYANINCESLMNCLPLTREKLQPYYEQAKHDAEQLLEKFR